jgi:hypothetical protein
MVTVFQPAEVYSFLENSSLIVSGASTVTAAGKEY